MKLSEERRQEVLAFALFLYRLAGAARIDSSEVVLAVAEACAKAGRHAEASRYYEEAAEMFLREGDTDSAAKCRMNASGLRGR